jgi:hypothetical protein
VSFRPSKPELYAPSNLVCEELAVCIGEANNLWRTANSNTRAVVHIAIKKDLDYREVVIAIDKPDG